MKRTKTLIQFSYHFYLDITPEETRSEERLSDIQLNSVAKSQATEPRLPMYKCIFMFIEKTYNYRKHKKSVLRICFQIFL